MSTAETPTEPRTNAMSALLARNWWAVGLRGVAAVLFGVIALLAPGATILSLLAVFAVLMLMDGVLNLIAGLRSARRGERWVLLVLQGVASLAAAVVAVLLPGLTMLAFVYLIAAWAIVYGVLGIAAAIRLRGDHGRWWMAASGVLAVVGGVLLGVFPLIGSLVLAWWLGAYALIFGGTLLVLAYRLHAQRPSAHRGGAPHPA